MGGAHRGDRARASSSGRSRRPPIASSARSKPGSASSWASTASSTTRQVAPPLQRIDPAAEREQVARARAAASGARRGRLGGGAGPAGRGRGRHGQPGAADHRRRQGARHAGRDQRPAAGGVGRAPRAGDRLRRRRRQGGRGRTGTVRFGAGASRRVVVRDIDAALGFYRDTLGPAGRARSLPIASDGVTHRVPDGRRVEGRAGQADRRRRPAWRASSRREGRASITSASRSPTSPPRSTGSRPTASSSSTPRRGAGPRGRSRSSIRARATACSSS